MIDRWKQIVLFLMLVHRKEGNVISSENLEELDMIYGIHPGDDDEATVAWIMDSCDLHVTEKQGSIYLGVDTDGVLQMVKLERGTTKRQVMMLLSALSLEFYP